MSRGISSGIVKAALPADKTHMHHLYAKLGAHRRGEAVACARALGLLAPPEPALTRPAPPGPGDGPES